MALPDLAGRLGLGDHEHVAVVGAGGKTTTVHGLAHALGGARVITTTTKMGHDQHGGLDLLVGASDDDVVAAARGRAPVVVWAAIDGSRATGVSAETCDRWFGRVDHVLIEADGARRRSFKAPGVHEPVVPSSATALVVVVGADALGRVIADGCHRPEVVARLAGCRTTERLTPERAAAVLAHERGFAASRPPAARMAVVVTKVDDGTRSDVARLVAALSERGAGHPALADLDVVAMPRT